MSKQKRFPFVEGEPPEENAPDFRERRAVSQGVRSIRGPVQSLMQGVNVRILVNGLDAEAKNGALDDLFAAGVTPEHIETELRSLSRRAPRHFDPQNVEQTILWVNAQWDERHKDWKPKKPR